MEKPNNKIIDQIETILQDIEEMKNAIPDLKRRANELASQISSLHYKDRINTAAYLYWIHPEINARVLAQATVGKAGLKKFRDVIGSVSAGISCTQCGEDIEITSRARLKHTIDWQNSILCDDCKEIKSVEYWAEHEEKDLKKANRLNELKRMPYQEYLKTEEWQERRKRHLKSARYRCQVCNGSSPPLDVHHRTYQRRGEEYYNDLIVLCRDCHEIYHKKEKLPLET